jgi:hypothetical protein
MLIPHVLDEDASTLVSCYASRLLRLTEAQPCADCTLTAGGNRAGMCTQRDQQRRITQGVVPEKKGTMPGTSLRALSWLVRHSKSAHGEELRRAHQLLNAVVCELLCIRRHTAKRDAQKRVVGSSCSKTVQNR